MALSTVISAGRTAHRTARVSGNGFQGTLALDWANGQATVISTTSLQTSVFDATFDRIVYCSPGVTTACWITVGTNPTASSSAAGNMLIPAAQAPIPVYVPANNVIAVIGTGSGGSLMTLPALIAADPLV